MRAYTLKEVSKKINVTPGIIRKWEKDLPELLKIPRSKQGARIFSDLLIDQLLEIKEMYGQKLGKEKMKENLQKNLDTADADMEFPDPAEVLQEEHPDTVEVSLEVVTEPVSVETKKEEAVSYAKLFFDAMDIYKDGFLNEVKEEIRNVVRKEVLEEVKREIKNGTYHTVKSLSDSIYKSSANIQTEIQELSGAAVEASKLTADQIHYLSNSIKQVSIDTYDEISSLSKQISETSDVMANYMETTKDEIFELTEAISKDREMLVEEREQIRHEIRQREAAFQQMLTNFRDVAAAKEKKWWKFWN